MHNLSEARRAGPTTARGTLVHSIDNWRLFATAALSVIALALTGLLVTHGEVFERRVRGSIEVARLARRAHEAMLEQDRALRGYVITGGQRFLSAYERGRRDLLAIQQQQQEAAGDSLHRLQVDVRVAQVAWHDGWAARALAFGQAERGEQAAVDEVLILEDRSLFDQYRAAHESLITQLEQDRDAALSAQGAAIVRTATVALVVAVLAAGVSIWRGRRFRQAIERALAAVQHRLDRVRAGELDRGPVPTGPAELAAIQIGIDDTAVELAQARAELEDSAEQLRLQNRQLGQVLRFAREVAGSLSLRYVLRGLCEAASTIAGSGRVVVWLRSTTEPAIEAVADSAGPGMEPVGLDPITIGDGLVGRAARFGRVERGAGGLLDGPPDDGASAAGALAVPMVVGAEVIGVLEVHRPAGGELPESTLHVLEALAVQAGTAVGAARLHEHTETMAMTDALTQLPNRRRLEADLAREVDISTRYGRPLGFAMVDVDHFKAYNDALGHQAADVALQSLAQVLVGQVRAGDTVYRYGGEELAVLMRETHAAAALQLADRLRKAVEHHFASPGEPRPVTISVGVSALPEHASSGPVMVEAADQALYEAKRSGRNRACVAAPQPAPVR